MHPAAHGRSDDESATAGFAQALSSASTQARPEASPVHPLTQATPQASLARPGAYGKNEEGLAATGFAQVILGAAGSRRNVKDSRQQPKEQDKRPATAPVTMLLVGRAHGRPVA